jgi:DNA repair protein RadA/Sms
MKLKKIYICSNCGSKYSKWQGQCTQCGKWNTLIEDVIKEDSKTSKKKSLIELSSSILNLKDISTQNLERISTDISEFDRVLSGGVVRGQTILIGGIPGIGKSTLILQVANSLSSKNIKVLYISAEESQEQLFERAKRLEIKSENIYIASFTDLGDIIKAVDELKPDVLIIDSIQMITHPESGGITSGPANIKATTEDLVRIAKLKNIIIFIVGQVTKEGDFAGPKLLEHLVDTVLYFENEREGIYRVLRTFKNRFGNIDEVGIFEMKEKGLVSSSDFSIISDEMVPGKTYSSVYEGTRAIIVSVEALVNRSFYPYPKRVFSFIDPTYSQILLASIEKNTPIKFDTYDVYVNIRSQFKTKDKGIDLAVCAAIIGSAKGIVFDNRTAFIGEVSMLGEVYPPAFLSKRISEIERKGFKRVYIPNTKEKIETSLDIVRIKNIDEFYTRIVKK